MFGQFFPGHLLSSRHRAEKIEVSPMPYEDPYAPSLWPHGVSRIAGLVVATERSWVCPGSQGRVNLGMTLTPLLTPLRAQHALTVSNASKENGLSKPILQPTAISRNRCRRSVAPKFVFELRRSPLICRTERLRQRVPCKIFRRLLGPTRRSLAARTQSVPESLTCWPAADGR
jgi:hypothetical protein